MILRDVLRSGYQLRKYRNEFCTRQYIVGNDLRVTFRVNREIMHTETLDLDGPIDSNMEFILWVNFSEELAQSLLISNVVPLESGQVYKRNHNVGMDSRINVKDL